MRRQTSKPSMSGIMTSSRTMSHSARSHMASASAPLNAVLTSKYSADSRASSSLTLAGTSSTTRIRALIELVPSRSPEEMAHRLDELAHRDRLGQIGLAAALADALLVALHRKSRHRHYGDRLQLGIVLQPLRHFQAGDFRQLDIHQNEVGPVLAREVESLDAVPGSDRAVAVRFKEIVEELHVELVVFHDQDGFRHAPRPFCPQSATCPTRSASHWRARSGMIGCDRSADFFRKGKSRR